MAALLTQLRHLGHRGIEGPAGEGGRVVVDVLHFDDELRLGLQRLLRVAVQRLGVQHVVRLALAVQALDGVNVARHLVDDEDGAGSVAAQDVADGAVAFVRVRVELQKKNQTGVFS